MKCENKDTEQEIEVLAENAVRELDNGRYDSALDLFEDIVYLYPENAPAQYECAKIHLKREERGQALDHISQAILSDATKLDYILVKAGILHDLKKSDESLVLIREYVELHPHNPLALTVCAYYLHICGQEEEAESICRDVIKKDSTFVEAYQNLGLILYHQNRFEESLKIFEDALALAPNNLEFHTYLGMIHLLLGHFKKGWHYYQKRMDCQGMVKRSLPWPVWQGESLRGKKIFVYAEQGVGDSIQFARYLPILAKRFGACVTFEVQTEILGLFKDFPGIDTVTGQTTLPQQYDYQSSLISLAATLETDTTSIPLVVPHLYVDKRKKTFWKNELATTETGKRIGFVWAGSPLHENDQNRSCPVECFAPLWQETDLWWFSLQKGAAARQLDSLIVKDTNVFNLNPAISSFEDTAAIIMNLDLIVTVDTAVAHLAATLGKPVYLLLPFTPDWRWLLGREDSQWYPKLKIFRQQKAGDWGGVFLRLEKELREKAGSI